MYLRDFGHFWPFWVGPYPGGMTPQVTDRPEKIFLVHKLRGLGLTFPEFVLFEIKTNLSLLVLTEMKFWTILTQNRPKMAIFDKKF